MKCGLTISTCQKEFKSENIFLFFYFAPAEVIQARLQFSTSHGQFETLANAAAFISWNFMEVSQNIFKLVL
jgi:hypothetical protein